VKPPSFDYVAPRTVPEVLEALADPRPDVRVLAGGQSLILEMHLERIRPDLVVDINQVPGLDRLDVSGGGSGGSGGGSGGSGAGSGGSVEIGALVRHGAFESTTAVPGPLGTLFSLAVDNIAHPPIRNRGTMVGSLAWAHPASEWCAVAVALDATIALRGPEGPREVPASDWFLGTFKTARRPGELITAVRFPLLGADTGVGFIEHRRTHFCFAMVAVAAALTIRDGVVEEARIGLVNCGDRPLRARNAERALTGAPVGSLGSGYRLPERHPFVRAGRIAAEDDADPIAGPYADLEYLRHAIAVVVGRTLRQAAEGVSR
jgi:carbon-monoxide dehydrogenase medium subunit